MIIFDHSNQNVAKAIGFESDKDMYAYTISALAAIEDKASYESLSDKEKVTIIALAVAMVKDTSLFSSISRYTEAVFTSPTDDTVIDLFVEQVLTGDILQKAIDSYTKRYNEE